MVWGSNLQRHERTTHKLSRSKQQEREEKQARQQEEEQRSRVRRGMPTSQLTRPQSDKLDAEFDQKVKDRLYPAKPYRPRVRPEKPVREPLFQSSLPERKRPMQPIGLPDQLESSVRPLDEAFGGHDYRARQMETVLPQGYQTSNRNAALLSTALTWATMFL